MGLFSAAITVELSLLQLPPRLSTTLNTIGLSRIPGGTTIRRRISPGGSREWKSTWARTGICPFSILGVRDASSYAWPVTGAIGLKVLISPPRRPGKLPRTPSTYGPATF